MRRAAMVLVCAGCLAGCGSSAPGPSQAVQSYVNSLSEGNYSGACASLDTRTRESLLKAAGSKLTCGTVLQRCLPNKATILKKDQTQLFYANVQTSVSGSRATATVSGTLVASAIRSVALRNERGQWMLSSPGVQVRTCAPKLARRARHNAGRAA